MNLINKTTNTQIYPNIAFAHTLFQRCIGLIGRKDISQGLIIPTRFGIHTFGMREPIDVLAVDAKRRVIKMKLSLPPNRIALFPTSCVYVVELPCQTIAAVDLSVGYSITWG
jgi:hypothetical protein